MQILTAPSSPSLATPFPLSRISSNTSSALFFSLSHPFFASFNLGKSNHGLRFKRLSRCASEINGAFDDFSVASPAFDSTLQSRAAADWESARTYKVFCLTYEGKVEGHNRGGLKIRFNSIMGFLPFPALCPSRFCGDPECNLEAIAQDLVGSVLTLKVIFVDENEKRLIFSEAKATFMEHVDSINVGDTFDGRVGPVMDYGALVYLRFPDGKYYMKGLIHKSEISWDFVRNPGDFLTLGDNVRVMVTSIDRETMRIYLSLKQLEEDPLHETLDKVIHQDDTVSHSPSTTADYDIDPLPGLKEILIELLQEHGISDVIISRQGFERRVVSPDLQIWLSNAPAIDNQVTLLARAGRQVQEIQLTTSLDHNGVRKALQQALERVP